MSQQQFTRATVTILAEPGSWIETGAVDQCHQVAALDGMIHVAGMPDLHPGKGAPIGAAMLSSVLYPFLVGSDIGCGIAVYPFRLKRVVPERLAGRFPDLDVPVDPADLPDGGLPAGVSESGIPAGSSGAGTPAGSSGVGIPAGSSGVGIPARSSGAGIPAGYVDQLGTVGRGNHFVELAKVDEVLDSGHAERLGLAAGDTVLIVHSGSRGLGERILRSHTEVHGAGPAADPQAYLAAHDDAVRWGHLNRRIMAERVADALGAELGEPVTDVCHNSVEIRDGLYPHRKGAAPGDGTDVLIAGTRGTRSFLVAGHAGPQAGHSVAHGAGRKMSRTDALRRGRAKHTVEELRRTAVGSIVVCGDRQLLFEEAPGAYKRIEQVIGDLVAHRLATPVVSTVPLVTYKTADLAPRKGDRR